MIPLALISQQNAHGVFEDTGREHRILLENVGERDAILAAVEYAGEWKPYRIEMFAYFFSEPYRVLIHDP